MYIRPNKADYYPLAYLRLAHIYKIPNYGYGFIWNWYNPIAWGFASGLLSYSLVYYGLKYVIEYPYEYGFRLPAYYRKHPEEIEWITYN